MGNNMNLSSIRCEQNLYSQRGMHKSYDQFKSLSIDKSQFVSQMYRQLENCNHQYVGKIYICNSYLMQCFYENLKSQNQVKIQKLKECIIKSFKDREYALEKSFQMINPQGGKILTQDKFVRFMTSSFECLIKIASKQGKKHNYNATPELSDWILQNCKRTVFEKAKSIFKSNFKAHQGGWNKVDYTRWVEQGKYWTLNFQHGKIEIKVPLNLLCVFGPQFNKNSQS